MSRKRLIGVAVLCLSGLMLWSYWPTILTMIRAWSREPDYSHGFLVLPFALYLLWVRRDSFPGIGERLCWGGLSLVALAGGLRILAAQYYFEALDGYTIPLWIAGLCWFFGGRAFLRWSLPVVLFLAFMVPLPFRLEYALSQPLQKLATHISCYVLQCLGQPAVISGTTVLLPETTLDVEEACSGLRLFMGFFAVSVAYVLLAAPPLWQTIVILLAVAPIAVVSNVLRIVGTGFAMRYVGGERAQKISHDAAGWVMILLAAALLSSLLWYLNRLVQEVRPSHPLSLDVQPSMGTPRTSGRAK